MFKILKKKREKKIEGESFCMNIMNEKEEIIVIVSWTEEDDVLIHIIMMWNKIKKTKLRMMMKFIIYNKKESRKLSLFLKKERG